MRNSEPQDYFPQELLEVLEEIDHGRFGHIQDLKDLINTIRYRNDHYLIGADFASYV